MGPVHEVGGYRTPRPTKVRFDADEARPVGGVQAMQRSNVLGEAGSGMITTSPGTTEVLVVVRFNMVRVGQYC